MRVPTITTTTIASATGTGGTYNYDMLGVDRASLQLNTVFSNSGDTDIVTLKISNDGVSFVAFSTSKTVTFTGGTTDHALFELGPIDYRYLQVSWANTSAHTFTLTGVLYATATTVQGV